MPKHVRFIVVLLPMFSFLFVHGQSKGPTKTEYKASVASVVADSPKWRKTIESVKVDDLPVSYAIGRHFQQEKDLTTKNLNLAVFWANRLQHEDSLFVDVNFMSSIQGLQSELQQFGALLLEFDLTDPQAEKQLADLAVALAGIANGSMAEVVNTSFNYTTRRALQSDQNCSRVVPEK